MKKISLSFTYLLFSLFFLYCSNSDNEQVENSDITGKWKLTEYLADPGDGSGTFKPTEIFKTMEFSENGNLTITNGTICVLNFEEEPPQINLSYTIEDNKIITDECEVFYEFQNNNLIIWQPCIEGCGEKYIKTN
ncbi:hypothetical protein [Abyssalbus ytuae]|uniref:Lipocalin-like domain-containing protein n=1 Tax=Abyssalbus ytuae TaxID=2926907 RepID=A0A9E6ZUK1_9FLAO|nr:hypothetical protein [Abyssalbus ytuae]UOB18073.1 hypothetical protein MQE35_01945 [Abyssalbus ytuae]